MPADPALPFEPDHLTMDNWLNYHHLYYFYIIAEEGSISSAARRLRLGQSTLSMQIKQLEENMNTRLFDREQRKITLTENGKIALRYAREIFGLGSELLDTLNDRRTPSRVRVQIGITAGLPQNISFRLIHSCYSFADANVSVTEAQESDLLNLLLAHQIDLFLTHRAPASHTSKKLRVKSLGKLNLIVAGSKKYRGLKRGFPNSLNGAPFIASIPGTELYREITQYFEEHSIHPEIVAQIQQTSLQKIMASNGIGLVILPELALSAHLKRGDLMKLGTLEGFHEELFLVSSKRTVENPIALRLFKSFHLA